MPAYQEILENRVEQIFEELDIKKPFKDNIKTFIEPLKLKDIDTYLHSLRVAILSVEIAKGLSKDLGITDLRPAAYGGYAHDVGKLAIPDETLKKKEDYTKQDMEKMKPHTIHSFNMIHGTFLLSSYLALEHHSDKAHDPYPSERERKKQEAKLPPGAKEAFEKCKPVVEIADVYDAMVTRDNQKYGGRMDPKDTKPIMLKIYPQYKELIQKLYNKRILGVDYNKTLGITNN
ncbi:hypothetical protein AYK26_07180 [Euryarchaeota archaeon SM23-78]|nr:MAG: hypothetical protein AYK26_07180 [Euryarchaeota archaeon SM23-78]MBW3001023.1 HD domain-containing protein [Candidatus Woesearchaeota archaeon]